MATAVNFHSMASNLPLDFMPMHHTHSRSNSVSSSPNSRPQSSQGGVLRSVGPLSAEDLFRTSYHQPRQNPDPHARNTSHTSSYLPSTDLISPADSPPNHNLTNPALKSHIRASHIRARAAASPYPRDADSVHSSSSETEDPSMFLPASSPADYPSLFSGGPIVSSQDTVHATGAFGRMTLSPDHTLEKLAANVRAATTTSASDRAKQIFVQAW
jgi:regulatory factor X